MQNSQVVILSHTHSENNNDVLNQSRNSHSNGHGQGRLIPPCPQYRRARGRGRGRRIPPCQRYSRGRGRGRGGVIPSGRRNERVSHQDIGNVGPRPHGLFHRRIEYLERKIGRLTLELQEQVENNGATCSNLRKIIVFLLPLMIDHLIVYEFYVRNLLYERNQYDSTLWSYIVQRMCGFPSKLFSIGIEWFTR